MQSSTQVPVDDLTRVYRKIRLIRHAEEEIARVYPTDVVKSPVHLSIGQESIAVGVCEALRVDDPVAITYRGHAVYLAKGGSLPGMMAELYGKADGCAGGKGGSMHLVDRSNNILCGIAVVGAHIPIAVGHALAFKRRGEDSVAVCFLGDGATEEGVFTESLNFAVLHKLPILFVCENNGYAIHAPLSQRWASASLAERVHPYGIGFRCLERQDVFEIRDAARDMVTRIRAGGGPQLLECKTYRWREHVGPSEDYHAGYRSAEEVVPWKDADDVSRLAAMLPEAVRRSVDAEIEAEVAAALAFAETSPFPEQAELMTHVYA